MLRVLAVLIAVYLARKQGRSPFLWGATAAFGFVLPILALFFFTKLSLLNDLEKRRSLLIERAVCGLILLFVLGRELWLK